VVQSTRVPQTSAIARRDGLSCLRLACQAASSRALVSVATTDAGEEVKMRSGLVVYYVGSTPGGLMRTLAVSAILLMLVSPESRGDPGVTTTRLMATRVSLLTLGDYLLGEAITQHLKVAFPGASTWAAASYDWESDRINVFTSRYVDTAAELKKSSCKELIDAVKARLNMDPATGKPVSYPNFKPESSNAEGFFTQDGYNDPGWPKDFGSQIDKVIVLHGLIQNTKDFSIPVVKCQSPLTSSEVMYTE
jgi:hypothetical protein